MKPLAVWLLVVLSVTIAGMYPRNAAAVPVSQRCNDQVGGDLDGQVRDFERHPPADANIEAGFVHLQSLIGQLAGEDGVLQATCGSGNAALPPLVAQIRSAEARAYALESDLTLRAFAKCTGHNTIAAGYVAAAWLALARAMPDSGVVPQPVQEMIPGVTRRAASVGLKLPSFADATNYWMTTVQKTGKQAADACEE